MASATVSPQGDLAGRSAPVSPQGDGKAAEPKLSNLTEAQAKALETRIAELTRTNTELSASERYWADRAQQAPPPAATAPPAPENFNEFIPEGPKPREGAPDYSDPTKFVEALSEKGPVAIVEALAQFGILPRDQILTDAAKVANGIVERKAATITADAALVGQYPELKDENSELFKATRIEYRNLVAVDPKLAKSSATLIMAARTAKLALDLKAAQTNGGQQQRRAPANAQPEDATGFFADDGATPEERERRERIAAQSGDRGHGANRETFADEGDELSAVQRSVIAAFNADGGFQITEDAYKNRARNGVQMGRVPTSVAAPASGRARR
jgi:hypothetical protein